MLYLFLIIFQLVLLFFLSKRVRWGVSKLFYKITKRKKPAAYLFAVLFLPGTYIHELSHLLVALLLFVPVGKLELIPALQEDRLKLGSVTIGKTGAVRRFMVGIAPLVFGIGVLMLIASLAVTNPMDKSWWEYVLYLYIVFTVSNTMFMSKSDLEGGWKIFLALFIVILLLYVLGFRASVSENSFIYSDSFNNVLKTANTYLLFPVALDLAMVVLGKILSEKGAGEYEH